MQVENKHFISNSEIQTYKRCRRKWYLGWYRKLAPKYEDFGGVMRSGTRVHKALAEWYVPNRDPNLDLMEVLNRIIQEDKTAIMSFAGTEDVQDLGYTASALVELEKAATYERAMVEGYLQWIEETGIDSELTSITTEQEITIPYGGPLELPIYFVGIVDALQYSTQQHALAFIDHKTVQSLTQPMLSLRMNEQMLHYIFLLQEATGEKVVGAFYNMLKRVKRTATAKPPFYDRVFISHSPIEMENYRRRLYTITHTLVTIVNNLNKNTNTDIINSYMYPTPNQDCSWSCPFFSVCPLFDDGSDVERMLEYRYNKYEPLDRYATVIKKES